MSIEVRPADVRRIVLRNPVHLVSFGLGVGLSPVAPGTFGTLLAIPIYLVLASFSTAVYLSFVIALFVIGCWTSGRTSHALGIEDHRGIVIDEIVGYLVTMLFVPLHWYWVIAGFVLFRVFDIWKPVPISVIDRRVKGGVGIMLDDLLAAGYSLILLHAAVQLLRLV